ncbi:MAG: stage II sporulation protein R, partial [Clostridia bacterium]|nr:stage II sporulation protein R [Clostridia bacterium]
MLYKVWVEGRYCCHQRRKRKDIMTMKQFGKAMWLPITALFLLTGLLLILPVGDEGEVYDKVIRLHVLANSDSEEDQALKLKVRDALLDEAAAMTAGCEGREEAEAALAAKTDILRQIAEETLRESGCERPVTVTIGQEVYPTRAYEGLRLP